MVGDGWEIDSHTISHKDLRSFDPVQLRAELVDSRAKLQRLFGVPADFICYPSGRYNATVMAAARAAGYLGATTTHPGLARAGQLFELRRVRVSGGESLKAFATLLGQR